jgi:transcriptional regulator of arginine metabolism
MTAPDMTDSASPLHRPATRAARLSAIEEALATHVITSQSQLSSILNGEGIEVTQATLSRDLDEMHATKTRLDDGTVAYTVDRESGYPRVEQVGGEEACGSAALQKIEQQMSRVLSGLVTSVAFARNLVVVHTPSGAAQYVASVIDRQPIDSVLGTIAGDDTVLVICTDERTAGLRAQWLLDIASQRQQNPS